VHYTALDNPTEGLNSVTLQQLVTHICMTYAQISQPDLNNNINYFNQEINPNLPLAIYMRIPISKERMVTTGTNCVEREETLSIW
jgi:hypothetical protein